jgi:phage virion morphogenesis protein
MATIPLAVMGSLSAPLGREGLALMAEDFKELENTLMALSLGLSDSERKKMAIKAAQTLRISNAKRIKANIDPEGNPCPKRINKIKTKSGKRRRGVRMFQKLRELRHLKYKADQDGLEIGFTGGTAIIARIHHEGQTAYVNKRKSDRKVQYKVRRLLGVNQADEAALIDKVLELFKT